MHTRRLSLRLLIVIAMAMTSFTGYSVTLKKDNGSLSTGIVITDKQTPTNSSHNIEPNNSSSLQLVTENSVTLSFYHLFIFALLALLLLIGILAITFRKPQNTLNQSNDEQLERLEKENKSLKGLTMNCRPRLNGINSHCSKWNGVASTDTCYLTPQIL